MQGASPFRSNSNWTNTLYLRYAYVLPWIEMVFLEHTSAKVIFFHFIENKILSWIWNSQTCTLVTHTNSEIVQPNGACRAKLTSPTIVCLNSVEHCVFVPLCIELLRNLRNSIFVRLADDTYHKMANIDKLFFLLWPNKKMWRTVAL